jgi:hypothetical protein
VQLWYLLRSGNFQSALGPENDSEPKLELVIEPEADPFAEHHPPLQIIDFDPARLDELDIDPEKDVALPCDRLEIN